MISTCTCKHPGQDALHGKNKRVFNPTAKNGERQLYRCTVCTSEKGIGKAATTKKGKK